MSVELQASFGGWGLQPHPAPGAPGALAHQTHSPTLTPLGALDGRGRGVPAPTSGVSLLSLWVWWLLS